MAERRDDITVIPPSPIHDEQQPLLGGDGAQQDHGTIDRDAVGGQEEGGEDVVEEPMTTKVLVIMLCLWVGSFWAAMDSTIVATLASPISRNFHSSTLLSWIATGYLIANAAFQPLSGKMSDIYGRKAGIIFASSFFAIGTLICGLAQNAPMMIFGRVVAGTGGGCLNTISTFIASDLIPLRKRGLWQGFANLIYGTGMGLGGIFGGLMNDNLSWRWAFYIQVPFIVIAGLLGWFFIDIPVKEGNAKERIKRVDFLGAITLCTALVLLLLGLNSGGNIVPWNHPLVYVSLPLSGVALAAFVYIEDRVAKEPVIPVRLLLHRTVASACLTNWFLTMAVYALFYYVPIYFQIVQGLSATAAGTRLVPQSIGTACGSLGAGVIMRATGRYWWLSTAALTMYIIAAILIATTFNGNVIGILPFVWLFFSGMAYGAMLTVTLLALLSAVGHEHQAVITSASYAFRSTGSTIGITIASAVFQNKLSHGLYERFGHLPGSADVISRIRDDVGDISFLPPGWEAGVRDTYIESLRAVWIVIVIMAGIGGVVSLFMKEHTLHNKLNRK
ncbi:putative major facilitator superfamily transporter [Aureobasidium pullulans]|uniref:MFS-type drug efflux transporter P55 n=1 Tax=Aureobasidium pullulans TaxID=5580 RepID=A0A4S8YTZ2_AURPU|nr:putative major facilitator superfamily transporter [Aureobasidium pullulans]